MNDSFLFVVICCGLPLLLFGGGLWLWFSRRGSGDAELRRRLIQTLTYIRHSSDPLANLDQAITSLQEPRPLAEILASLVDPSALPPAATPPLTAPEPLPGSAPAPLTPGPSAPSAPLPAPPRPSLSTWRANWVAPNTTTLLLYLGAALMVIAIGVFTASGWASIGPLVRWGVVLLVALLFLGSGIVLTRVSTTLRQAGETFRALGTTLLPFVALAYDRFVLDGQAPPTFWVAVGLGLAAIHYSLYWLGAPGRLNAYLSGLSLGLFALTLPAAFGLSSEWRGLSLLLFASALLLVARRFAPDGRALVAGFLRGRNHPLAESHLVIATLAILGSIPSIFAGASGTAALYFILLTLLLIWLSRWLRAWPVVALAALTGGSACIAGATWLIPTMDDPQMGLVLLAWAWLLWLAATGADRLLPHGRLVLTLAAVTWGAFALSSAHLDAVEPIHVAIAALYTLLLGLVAWRQQWPLALLGGWATLHVAIFNLLQVLATGQPSATLPTLIWLTLAAAWLALTWRRTPEWARSVWPLAFGLETLTIIGFASLIGVTRDGLDALVKLGVSQPIMAVAAPLLALGWVALARWYQSRPAIGVALALSLYGLTAIASALALVSNVYAVLVFGLGLALVLVDQRLPAYARPLTTVVGFGLLPVAVLSGEFAQTLVDLPAARFISQGVTAQWLLLATTVVYAWQTQMRQSANLALLTLVSSYSLAAWVTADHLPLAAAPLVTVGLGLATQALAPRAPGRSAEPIDVIGQLTTLFAPALGRGDDFTRGTGDFMGLSLARSGQLALLVAGAVFGARGLTQRRRGMLALAGLLVYGLYAWVAADDFQITQLQAYSVPLAVLVFAFQWLFPASRTALELASATILLVPGAYDSIGQGTLLYTVLLGLWGGLLLVGGITLGRRPLLVMGIVGLVVASIRQLWSIVSNLPPGVLIGLVALTLMGVAIWLLLNRNRLIPAAPPRNEAASPPEETV